MNAREKLLKMAAKVLSDAQAAKDHAFGLELSARHILQVAADKNTNAHEDYLEIILEECPELASEVSIIEPFSADGRHYSIPEDVDGEPIFNPSILRDRGGLS